MKISKWVDMGQEVQVEINANDIRSALAEAFAEANKDPLGEKPDRYAIKSALNQIGSFLNGMSDEQVGLLEPAVRAIVEKYLRKAADRFKVSEAPVNA